MQADEGARRAVRERTAAAWEAAEEAAAQEAQMALATVSERNVQRALCGAAQQEVKTIAGGPRADELAHDSIGQTICMICCCGGFGLTPGSTGQTICMIDCFGGFGEFVQLHQQGLSETLVTVTPEPEQKYNFPEFLAPRRRSRSDFEMIIRCGREGIRRGESWRVSLRMTTAPACGNF